MLLALHAGILAIKEIANQTVLRCRYALSFIGHASSKANDTGLQTHDQQASEAFLAVSRVVFASIVSRRSVITPLRLPAWAISALKISLTTLLPR